MIHLAVAQVVQEANAYINLRAPGGVGAPTDRVVSASLFKLDGTLDTNVRNRVVVQVVNVEKNTVYRSMETTRVRPDGVYERVNPSVRVNAYVLFIANFDDYTEALKSISLVMAFFQNRYTFEVPNNGSGTQHLVFDLHSLTFEELNHLWASLGAKYMPSVVYKAAILDIQDWQMDAEVPPVQEISTQG